MGASTKVALLSLSFYTVFKGGRRFRSKHVIPCSHLLPSMAQSTGIAELRALLDVMTSSVDKLEETMASRGQTYPSLDSLYSPESEAPRTSPDVLALGDLIVSAAAQLIAAVRPTPIAPLLTSLQVSLCQQCRCSIHLTVLVSSKRPHACVLPSEPTSPRS